MEYVISLLPVYALGNIHCLGMCGPLVMLLAQHRWKGAYFWGRLTSFTLSGALAGMMGGNLLTAFKMLHMDAWISYLFAIATLCYGLFVLGDVSFTLPTFAFWGHFMAQLTRPLSRLMLKDHFFPIFLFGFSTVMLPCGQTIMVLSASALMGSAVYGGVNGFVFAAVTSPALLFSMKCLTQFWAHSKARAIFGSLSVLVGCLFLLRGLAQMQIIEHCAFCLFGVQALHIALY